MSRFWGEASLQEEHEVQKKSACSSEKFLDTLPDISVDQCVCIIVA